MKIDELFERLRPVGASKEDFKSGSRYEDLLSRIEEKLDKVVNSSIASDEDLYSLFEEQRQTMSSVLLSMREFLLKKDSESAEIFKESLKNESKVTKITRKVLKDRPDEDKLKFTDAFEASVALSSNSEEIESLIENIKEYKQITEQNREEAKNLSNVFNSLVNELKESDKLGVAASEVSKMSEKFAKRDSLEKEETAESLARGILEKSEDIDFSEQTKTSLSDIYRLISERLKVNSLEDEDDYLSRITGTEKENTDKNEGYESLLKEKLKAVLAELDGDTTSDSENLVKVESDSVERVNANSEEYLSSLKEDQSYKQDIALIREDVSKILSLMEGKEDESSSEDSSEQDSENKSSGGGFSLGSMFGMGKLSGAITKLGPLLGKLGLVAGATTAVAWAGYEAYDAYQESVKAREDLDRATQQRNSERAKELEELEKNDEDNIAKQIKIKNKEIYGTENPTEEMYVEYEKSKDNILKRAFVPDEVYESRASRRKDEIIRQATNIAKYGTETPNAAMIEDYDEMKYQTKRLGISKDEWYRVKDYIEHPSEDSYNSLSSVEKDAVSNFKMSELKTERVIKDNELLSQRDKMIDSLVEGGRENDDETRKLAIEQLQRSNYITESQLKMLNSTPYGEKVTKPVGINPRLEKNEWAVSLKESYRKAGITDEETLNALVAQDAHESGWGESSQSKKFNNFGNIHAGKFWKGKTSKGKDTRADGTGYETDFRVYDSMDDYAADKVKFLKQLYDFNEDDSLEEILNKLQGGNKAGRRYAEATNYKDAVANIYYGTSNKTYFEDSNVLNEARMIEWNRKMPNLNPKQYNGGFKDGVWLDNKDYSQFESGDMISFRENKVLPQMLGYTGYMNNDGSYNSITVNSETLEPVKIKDGKNYDISGNEIPASSLKVVKVDSPEYDEIIRRQLKKQSFLNEEENDKSTWAKNQFGDETNLTVRDQKAFYNSAIAAAKNSKGITVKEAQLRAREFSNINRGISSGKGDFISLPVDDNKEGEFDLSKLNLGEPKSNNTRVLDMNYIEENDWVVDMSKLNGSNVIKAEPLDDMRGTYEIDENGNRVLVPNYKGEQKMDLRSDFTKSIQSGFKKATSKMADWMGFQKKVKAQEQAIDMNRVTSVQNESEDVPVKKVEVVQGTKPNLPELKPSEHRETKETKKILDKSKPTTSTNVTNITTYNSVDSLMRDDVGNIGTA